MLGSPRPLDTTQQVLALLLAFLAVIAFVRLQSMALDLRAREGSSRWASNLRDGVNFAAMGLLAAVLLAAGHPAPSAVLYAGTLIVALDIVRHWSTVPERRRWLSALVGLTLVTLLVLFPAMAVDLANRVADQLFGTS